MESNQLLEAAMLGMVNYNNALAMGRTLTEFELLAYEQAFRTYETVMRVYRTTMEKMNESESPAD